MLPPPTFPDPTFHSPALLELIGLKVTEKFADHLTDSVVDAVDTASSKEPTVRNRTRLGNARVPDFKYFASNLISNTSLGMPVLLVALVYITRAKPHLRIERDEWAYERVFLGALVLALKYTIDATPRTIRWVRAAAIPGKGPLFNKRDVNRMEREFLGVLNWELGLTEEDILSHHRAITGLYYDTQGQSSDIHCLVPSRTMRPPLIGFAPLGDTSAPMQKSTDGNCLSSPLISVCSISVPGQSFILMERAEHSYPYPVTPSTPFLPWRNEDHPMPKQCTIQ